MVLPAAAVCRSTPKSHRSTISSNTIRATRLVKLPPEFPGKLLFKSRRSGIYLDWLSNPKMFTIGTSSNVPASIEIGPPGSTPAIVSSYISSWITPTPLSSSPWIAAVTITVGPATFPRTTRTGK